MAIHVSHVSVTGGWYNENLEALERASKRRSIENWTCVSGVKENDLRLVYFSKPDQQLMYRGVAKASAEKGEAGRYWADFGDIQPLNPVCLDSLRKWGRQHRWKVWNHPQGGGWTVPAHLEGDFRRFVFGKRRRGPISNETFKPSPAEKREVSVWVRNPALRKRALSLRTGDAKSASARLPYRA